MWQLRGRRADAAAMERAHRRIAALRTAALRTDAAPPEATASDPATAATGAATGRGATRATHARRRRSRRAKTEPPVGEGTAHSAESMGPPTDGDPPRSGRPEPRDETDAMLAPLERAHPSLGVHRRLAAAIGDRVPPVLRAALWRLDLRGALVLVAVAIIAAGAAFVIFARTPRASPMPVSAVLPTFVTSGAGSSTASPNAAIVVDVAGDVVHAGVYTLPAGSRVIDAIDAAGGALPGVDLANLNLARVLLDGEQVAVGIPPATPPPDGVGGSVAPNSPLDLNSASAADLDALPGIGPVLAQRIVDWRDAHGRFSSVDELLEVSGIGASTLNDLTPLVRV